MMRQEHKKKMFLDLLKQIKQSSAFDVKKMAIAAILMALIMVLNIFGRFIVVIPVFGTIRLSFSTIFLVIAGFILNPILGFLLGFLVDIVSFFAGGVGVFHIGFALSSGLKVFLASIFSIPLIHGKYRFEKIQMIFSFLLILTFSLFLLIDDPLNIELYIRGIVVVFISLIIFSLFISLAWKKKGSFLNLLFIVLYLSIVDSLLNSIWLSQLYSINYNLLLWPRIFKSFIFDLPLLTTAILPLKIVCDKKQLYWYNISS